MAKIQSQHLATVIAVLIALMSLHSISIATVHEAHTGTTDAFLSLKHKQQRLGNEQETKHHGLPGPPPIFNPWTDFEFQKVQLGSGNATEASRIAFSSMVQCVGTGTGDIDLQADLRLGAPPGFSSRSCWYRNLYYNVNDQRFHYFASPQEQRVWNLGSQNNESTFDEQQRFFTSLGSSYEGRPDIWYDKRGLREPWKPMVQKRSQLPEYSVMTTTKEKMEAVFLLFQPSHSENFGHFLWDDLLSLFSLLDIFDLAETPDLKQQLQPVPFFVEQRGKGSGYGGMDKLFRCAPRNAERWANCTKMYKHGMPSLFRIATDCTGDIARTGNWFVQGKNDATKCTHDGNEWIAAPPQLSTEYIQIPNVLVGIGRLSYSGCWGDCSLGRGGQFYRFRTYLLQKLGVQQSRSCLPKGGYITFSIATHSSRPDKVHHFEGEIEACRSKYGNERVKVVSMSDYSLPEQATVVANSIVFFSNHGGGSAISVFLPKGATFFIYWHWHVMAKGRVMRKMDHQFYESVSHFETLYISEKERSMVDRTMAMVDSRVEKYKHAGRANL